jgi:hypothetical protein
MNAIEENKLFSIFDNKYKELVFSGNLLHPFDRWSSYLSHVGCIKFEFGTEIQKSAIENEILHDPSPFGGFILVPKDIAEKILVLGLP